MKTFLVLALTVASATIAGCNPAAPSKCSDSTPVISIHCEDAQRQLTDRYVFETRFFFNKATSQCESYDHVLYTGSVIKCMEATTNSFPDEDTCWSTCQSSIELEPSRIKQTRPPFVTGRPMPNRPQHRASHNAVCNSATYVEANGKSCSVPGITKAPETTMFQYNVQSGHCESFSYTGCRPVRNMFPSMSICERTCLKIEEPESHSCPPGETPVECLTDPCMVTTCPAVPAATCKPYYCGGCHAFYYLDGLRVNCTATFNKVPISNPNYGTGEEEHPTQQETTTSERERLISEITRRLPAPYPTSYDCPNNDLTLCHYNPCINAFCNWYPEAACIPDYCGGCDKTRFFVDELEIKQCVRRLQ